MVGVWRGHDPEWQCNFCHVWLTYLIIFSIKSPDIILSFSNKKHSFNLTFDSYLNIQVLYYRPIVIY